jgi:alginate O-acetyltransferase complex protein AlgI
VRYSDVESKLYGRTPTLNDAAYGLRRFIFGLSKKLLIANTVGAIADSIFDSVNKTASFPLPVAWLGAISYAMQIYYDFSGYSDMAIGLGRMFGFYFLENFDYPYSATGIRDFWRKWHISLSSWFREYVYIPLGGNRLGKVREGVNKLTVFFLTGLWHGASWTFVIWGLYHGFFLLLESYGLIRPGKIPRPLAWLYTMLVVVTGFVIFRANSLPDAARMLSAMFHVAGNGSIAAQFGQALAYLKPSVIPAFIAAAAASLPIAPALSARVPKLQAVGFALTAPLFLLCVLNLSTASYNPFIYYRF